MNLFSCVSHGFCYTACMTETKLTTSALLAAVTPVTAHNLDALIAKAQFDAFLEENEMFPIGGDLFEDAGGHVWHESNIEDEIKHQNKSK